MSNLRDMPTPVVDPLATRLLSQHARMKNARANFDGLYQDIAERIIPRKALFTQRYQPNETKGQRLTDKIFDAVPALALDRFAAAVHSLVTPKNQIWHKLGPSYAALANVIEVKRYFEALNEALFKARYAANFDNVVHECYYELGAFATMVAYVGDTGTKLAYTAIPLHQCYFQEDKYGVIDRVDREYPMTARNAYKEFGEQLPHNIRQAVETNPEQEFTFVCITLPREDIDHGRDDYRGMPIVQYEIHPDSKTILKEEGYRSMRYVTSRYSVMPGELYGRGPAELVLPDVRMLNSMNKTTMQGAELAVLPPLLATSEMQLRGASVRPAAINYGGIGPSGQALIQQLKTGADVGLGLEMMDQKREIIQDAFWNRLFQILTDNPQMTATEAMLRAQEKGALLAPTASRIESEFLERIVAAELSILMFRAPEDLPEPPEILLETGMGYAVEFTSPMAVARRAGQGVAVLRSVEQLTPAAQIAGPVVFRRFKWDEVTKIVAEANDVPARALYTDDELEAVKQAEAEEAQAQQMVEAAPQVAGAAKDLAQAQQLASAPQFALPAP